MLKELKGKKKRVEELTKISQDSVHRKDQAKVKNLKNLLEQTTMRFNEILSHNFSLRDQIDVLRRERVQILGVCSRLESMHEEKKIEIEERENLIEFNDKRARFFSLLLS